jgi:DNA mismatch repair ATPase MutS
VDQLFQELSRLRCQLKEAADEAWLQFLRDITATSYMPMKNANTAIATLDVLLALADVAKSENFVK